MEESEVIFQEVSFNGNVANFGAAVHLSDSELNTFNSLFIHDNTANMIGVVYLLKSTANFDSETDFSGNSGSCLVFNSKATFKGNTTFVNCSEQMRSHDTTEMQEGGALTIFKSVVIFYSASVLMDNHAENSGAIHATESKITYMSEEATLAYNTANETGGGVYLDMSELHCQGNSSLKLLGNSATEKGGGVHAISLSINVNGHDNNTVNANYSGSKLKFIKNEAEKGGGHHLEMNAKLYVLKSIPYNKPFDTVSFTSNSADYGGAVYISDDYNSVTCSHQYKFNSKAKDCFLQTL